MSDSDVSKGLHDAGLEALEHVEMGDIDLFAHDYEINIDVKGEFEDWFYNTDGLDEKSYDLSILIPGISSERLTKILENYNNIKKDELFKWGKNFFADIPSNATFYFFIPINCSEGEGGIAVIMSYGDIPGGEYELYDVFRNRESADNALKDIFWF